MVPSLIPALAGALLFFADLSSAVPAMAIMPHRTLAFRQATATASISSGSSASFPSRYSNSSTSTLPAPTTTPKVIFTETDLAGEIEGCTSVDTITYSHWSSGKLIATESPFCAPGVGNIRPLSTNTVIQSAWSARVSSLAPVSVPNEGCAIGTDKLDGSNTQYCTCAGSGTLSASRVSTILGYSSGTKPASGISTDVTTVCNTGPGSLPTQYVEVPAITDDNIDQLWAQTPSLLTNGVCTSGVTPIAECWGLLDMDEYVKWWWSAFNTTCDASDYGSGSSFGVCFYKVMTPNNSGNCSILTTPENACGDAPNWTDFENKWNGLRNFYVAWNIYTMQSFLYQYWLAIGQAQSIASETIGYIINIIDPIKNQNVGLNNILQALSTGLAFIPGPESLIAEALLAGAQQVPTVAMYLFPAGTSDSQLVEMQDVSENLAWVVETLENNLAQALSTMLNDVDTFATFAAAGSFSTHLTSINIVANDILTGLFAYLISQAYQENGVFITRQLNTSVHSLMTNGTELSYQLSCNTGYDSNGICDTFWYDSVDDTTYALTPGDESDRTKNYNSDMINWFSNWTTPELLFRGAAYCAAASNANQGSSSPLTVTTTDFNTNCLSNMQVCTWSLTPGTTQSDGSIAAWDPLFSDCSDKEVFSYDTVASGDRCSGVSNNCFRGSCTTSGYYFRAFRQYLGWGIHKPLAKASSVDFCAGG